MKLNAPVCLLISGLFISCSSLRQEVEPKGIAQEPEKLVVACFISPQDTILVASVTRSSPVLGVNNSYDVDVHNATVTLSDGSRSVILKPGSDPGSSGKSLLGYRAPASELPINAGKTYTLTVRVPDGRSVTAACTVPTPVTLGDVTVDSSTYQEEGYTLTQYYARLRWRDQAGQVNYYRIAGTNDYHFANQPSSLPTYYLQSGQGNWYFYTSDLLTDMGNDGQNMVSPKCYLVTPSTWFNGKPQGSRPVGQLKAYLLSVEENYYTYHEAVGHQNRAADNPFAEPVLIPTNIQGGLGCFGAYNRSTRTLMIN